MELQLTKDQRRFEVYCARNSSRAHACIGHTPCAYRGRTPRYIARFNMFEFEPLTCEKCLQQLTRRRDRRVDIRGVGSDVLYAARGQEKELHPSNIH